MVPRDAQCTQIYRHCIGPVSWFESNMRCCNDFIFSKFVGNVPLIPLLERHNDVAFEKVVANQSGSLPNIDVFDMSSSRILTWDCNQVGNRGPIWQDAKCAFRSLKGGNQSAFNLQIIGSHV